MKYFVALACSLIFSFSVAAQSPVGNTASGPIVKCELSSGVVERMPIVICENSDGTVMR